MNVRDKRAGGPALSLSGAVTGSRHRGAVRLTPYPFDELADVRVGLEGFERVVFAFEFLVGDRRVYVAVAGSAEVHRLGEHLAVECLVIALVFDLFVVRSGDEVMPGKLLHLPAAEPTSLTPAPPFASLIPLCKNAPGGVGSLSLRAYQLLAYAR